MTDTINDALEELQGKVKVFCEEYDIETDEAEFPVEISLNLEILSSSEVLGFKNLRDEIVRTIAERSAEAMLFFITPGNDEADITVRVGVFKEAGTWFAWI